MYQNCQYIANDEEIVSEDEIDKNLVIGYAIMNEKNLSSEQIEKIKRMREIIDQIIKAN